MDDRGIDIFATVSSAGYDVIVIQDENEKQTFYTLLLLE